jgi:hypothetical protein
MARRGYKVVKLKNTTGGTTISIITNSKVKAAADHLMDLQMFDWTRVQTLVHAAYAQGKKDGARAVFESIDTGIAASKRAIPHQPPGRPKRK